MAKKRLIFTLLYQDGGFMLSRNFRLQRAGNIDWLKKNYNFKRIAFSIDELIVLDVSRGPRDVARFGEHVKSIAQECFIPISVGGGITSQELASQVMQSGADKLVLNTALLKQSSLVKQLVKLYGSQCIIASVDAKHTPTGFECYISNGAEKVDMSLPAYIKHITGLGVGEIYLNSMDRDGTGHGYFFELLETLEDKINIPVILAGGAGNWHHLLDGSQRPLVSAAATANLFNFIGEGFPNARQQLLNHGVNLAQWPVKDLDSLKNVCLIADNSKK